MPIIQVPSFTTVCMHHTFILWCTLQCKQRDLAFPVFASTFSQSHGFRTQIPVSAEDREVIEPLRCICPSLDRCFQSPAGKAFHWATVAESEQSHSLAYPLGISLGSPQNRRIYETHFTKSHNQQPLTAEDLFRLVFVGHISSVITHISTICFSKMGKPPEAPKKSSIHPSIDFAGISTQDFRPRGSQLQLESFERNSLGQTAPEASAQAGKWGGDSLGNVRERSASNLRKTMELKIWRTMGSSHR